MNTWAEMEDYLLFVNKAGEREALEKRPFPLGNKPVNVSFPQASAILLVVEWDPSTLSLNAGIIRGSAISLRLQYAVRQHELTVEKATPTHSIRAPLLPPSPPTPSASHPTTMPTARPIKRHAHSGSIEIEAKKPRLEGSISKAPAPPTGDADTKIGLKELEPKQLEKALARCQELGL